MSELLVNLDGEVKTPQNIVPPNEEAPTDTFTTAVSSVVSETARELREGTVGAGRGRMLG